MCYVFDASNTVSKSNLMVGAKAAEGAICLACKYLISNRMA
jgi:hypothetical protein